MQKRNTIFSEIHNNKRTKCINTNLCGWCTDATGKGKCVGGSNIGPSNKDYKCRPQTGQKIYNWTYSGGLSIEPLSKKT